jgi:transposase
MSKLLNFFVGIDISKLFFDVALLKAEDPAQIAHRQFKQSFEGFSEMKEWLRQQAVLLNEETLFCMEYTGVYNTALINYLDGKKALIWVEMAMRIKKSEGFVRGSNDKTDAIKIARYAFRHQEDKQLWSPTDVSLNKIKYFIAQRDRIVETISKLTVPINELKELGCLNESREMEKLQKAAIVKLEKVKNNIESAIIKIVNQDKDLSTKVNRVKSIKGIGQVTAIAFLVYTKGFTSFDNGKQLSCYCGTVPFIKKQSGISVKSQARVSPFANKKLKRLLHLCALSAIKFDPELKAYYERKVLEGKNKMSVINAVRNKLVLRMFAVLRDERDFVENYERRCA